MIAVAGLARLTAGQHDDLAINARAQWSLQALRPISQEEGPAPTRKTANAQ
jgi:hypothetical protein